MPTVTRHPFRAVVALALVLGMLAIPMAAQADTKSDRAAVQRKKAAVAAQIDTLRATDAQVEAALRTLNQNVASQTAALRDAERKAAEAEAAFQTATAEVEAKKAEIATLDAAVKEVAIEAFIQPPSSTGLIDSLAAKNIGEAELKRSLLEAKSSNQLDVLDQLERAHQDLETARAAAEAASQTAKDNRAAVAGKLSEVTAARNQQAKVEADVQSRLDRQLSEAANLEQLDKSLAAKIQAEQARLAELAKRASRSSRSSGGSVTISITGSGSIVSVRGIRVHKSIADQLARMLSAAEADGISLSGGGYRDPSSQIALRRAHCGTSNYAVYQMSASSCSPPTARPGSSMHERGLAIDFTYGGRVIGSRSSPAYRWLAAHASSYRFYNLPSEPWHWSVNGN